MRRTLDLLFPAGAAMELRALYARKGLVDSGYFDDRDALVREAMKLQGAKGLYVVLNPIDPALLYRRFNQVERGAEATGDQHVLRRKWMLVDLDPARVSEISSTDSEHELAIEYAARVADELSEKWGWPRPILCDSGNGSYMIFRTDLPNDADARELIKAALEALDFHFSTSDLHVDRSVHNAARIVKLLGSVARKGSDHRDRPHRVSRILDVPDRIEVVTAEQLVALAGTIPRHEPEARTSPNGSRLSGTFDLSEWIARHGLDVSGPFPWNDAELWRFRVCPWNPDHTNKSAFLIRYKDGGPHAGCHHDSCRGKGFEDLWSLYESEPFRRAGSAGSSPRSRKAAGESAKPGGAPTLDEMTYEETEPAVETEREQSAPAVVTVTAAPLPEDLFPADPSPVVYTGLSGEIVRALSPYTEADPIGMLVQFHTLFGNAAGRGPHLMIGAERHGVNVYTLIIAKTGDGRKGTALTEVRAPIKLADPVWDETRIKGGFASGEGLIQAVKDGEDDQRLLGILTEFSGLLSVMARQGNRIGDDLRDAWDGKLQGNLTKNDPMTAREAHISVIGHITPPELKRKLNTTELANGFINRFLTIRTRRRQYLAWGSLMEQAPLDPYRERLNKALAFAKEPRRLVFDTEAAAVWAVLYRLIEEGRKGLLGEATARASPQILRLSALYALMAESPRIGFDSLRAALGVWEYSEASARTVFGTDLGDPTADEILRALRRRADGMSRTEISGLFHRNKSAVEIGAALGVLEGSGLAHSRQVPPAEGGHRPEERWLFCGGDDPAGSVIVALKPYVKLAGEICEKFREGRCVASLKEEYHPKEPDP